MKKEQAVLWLRDFREWMDQTVDGAANLGKLSDSNMCFDMGRDTKQTKREKHLGKRPLHVMDTLQTSKGEGSLTILETEVPFTVGQKLVDFNEKDILKQSVGSRIGFRMGKTDPENVQKEACCEEVPESVCVEKNIPSFTNLTVEVNEDTERHNNMASLTSIEEIIFSRQSSLCPVSPPHYQEDILHRRQNLEEEFLQLSAEAFSVASSDSDTSSSDDDSWELCDSCLEHSQLFNKESTKRIISDNASDFQLNNTSADAVKEGVSLSYNDPVETDASSQRALMSNHGKPFLIGDLDDSSSAETINQGFGDRRKGKWKAKRMVALISQGNSLAANKDPTLKRLDGVDAHSCDISSDDESHLDTLQDKEQMRLIQDADMRNPLLNCFKSAYLKARPSSLQYRNAPIEKYFAMNLAESGISDSCQEFICCDWISEEGTNYQER